jgi:hypothetical protein
MTPTAPAVRTTRPGGRFAGFYKIIAIRKSPVNAAVVE